MRRLAYQSRYGYPFRHALAAEFWWRLEHGPIARLRDYAYGQRKAAERRGAGQAL